MAPFYNSEPFVLHLESAYYVPDTILGSEDTTVNKTKITIP